MDKKGQSALEYLMTYGWALVVIVIVVAALFAFGVFRTPFTCSPLSGKMLLKDYTGSTGGIDLVVQNGTGGSVSSLSVSTSPTGLTEAGTNPSSLGNMDTNVLSMTGSLTSPVNETITITYQTADGLSKTETTTCAGTVS